MEDVINQPEIKVINKYLGFHQLEYLSDNGIDVVKATEVCDSDYNLLKNSPIDKLWSIRIAAITGQDFNLPSLIGVNKNEAVNWIKEQQAKDMRYVFFYSSFFHAFKSGRIHIERNITHIEVSNGDFNRFKHEIPDLSVEILFETFIIEKTNNNSIEPSCITELQVLSQKLRKLYKEEIDGSPNVVYEFDFAFGEFTDKNGSYLKDEVLKIVGMRSYDLDKLRHELYEEKQTDSDEVS